MSHLTAERLATLADLPPTAGEQAHLDACPVCCGEREAYASLAGLAAAERTRIGPPVSSWEAIAAGLRAEGVLRGAPTPAPLALVEGGRRARPTHVTLHVPRWALQAAAALLLVAGGVVAGRMSTAGGFTPSDGAGYGGRSIVTPVGQTVALFKSREEAQTALRAAEEQYQRAAEFLATTDSTTAPATETNAAEVYRTRLAAFDGVVAATQQALYAAPADPIINRYYLATSAAREVALKQLSLVAPAGVQVNRY